MRMMRARSRTSSPETMVKNETASTKKREERRWRETTDEEGISLLWHSLNADQRPFHAGFVKFYSRDVHCKGQQV